MEANTLLSSSEIYDPQDNSWTPGPELERRTEVFQQKLDKY